MAPFDLLACERQVEALVSREAESTAASIAANAFNIEATDVRDALLEPARTLLEEGTARPEMAVCLYRTVAELAFWRRVLVKAYPDAFGSDEVPPAFLVQYLLGEDECTLRVDEVQRRR